MNRLYRYSIVHCFLIAVLVLGGFSSGPVMAADSDSAQTPKSTDIVPYDGPTIYLDEPEPPPPATFVERQVVKNEYPDEKIRWERQVARYSDNSFVADGFYREYHPNGQLFVEGNYKDGRQEGSWTYWYEDGTQNRQVTYKNGKPDGSWESYRADGTLAAVRSFKDGRRDGGWIVYDETGNQPLREQHYVEGKPDGVWKQWFPSGQLHRQITLKDGVREGPGNEWREDGSKAVEMNYVKGRPHGSATLWSTDGRKFSQQYENGRLISEKAE
jgi:antitoxin component YwqK of YwqJK toxin-antitoxin module